MARRTRTRQPCLTMRLSDAGLRRRKRKPIYPDHRFPPWPTEDATREALVYPKAANGLLMALISEHRVPADSSRSRQTRNPYPKSSISSPSAALSDRIAPEDRNADPRPRRAAPNTDRDLNHGPARLECGSLFTDSDPSNTHDGSP